MLFPMVVLGLLTILAGLIPILNLLGETFTTGLIYSGIVSLAGIIGILWISASSRMDGTHKFTVWLMGIIVVLGGFLPFIQELITLPFEITAPVYHYIILGIGGIGLVIGFIQSNM